MKYSALILASTLTTTLALPLTPHYPGLHVHTNLFSLRQDSEDPTSTSTSTSVTNSSGGLLGFLGLGGTGVASSGAAAAGNSTSTSSGTSVCGMPMFFFVAL